MRDLLPKIQSNDGQFHNGNPATGEQGTRVTDTWLNDVQEHIRDFGDEFKYLLKQAELEPDPAKKTQIYDAIEQIIENKRRAASLTQSGEVELDSSTDSNAEDKAATPKAVNVVKALVTAVRNALNNYIPNSKKSDADNSTSSDTVATSYALKKVRDIATTRATDTIAGQTVLSHKINGTDKTKAASEFALGELNKELAGKGVPLGAVVSFPKGMNPLGYLRAIGGTFNKTTYPDLYIANGNSDILPNLHRSDVGMTAYFPFDSIPEGWIAFDSIRSTVTQQNYPELYQYLVDKYGSISNVPLVEDRFIRNVGNGLSVGQTQSDEIKKHVHTQALDDGGRDENKFNSIFDKNSISDYDYNLNVGLPVDNGYSDNFWATPRLDSKLATGGDETRPKSIALKLCVKARNTFDDVVFWIKAFGSVENTGQMDAANLAQEIQDIRYEKADKIHNHSYSDIVDFNEGVAAQFFYQKTENFEVFKYPDGSMIQIYKSNPILNHGNTSLGFTFNWAQAFKSNPALTWSVYSEQHEVRDCWVTFNKSGTTNTKVKYWIFEGSYNTSNLEVNIIAIGRWK
ncbi:TPA: phage tail protein [Pasteurella multocida]